MRRHTVYMTTSCLPFKGIDVAIEAKTLEEATRNFPEAVKKGVVAMVEEMREIRRRIILACGTSWHAGLIGEYLLEELKEQLPEVVSQMKQQDRYEEWLKGLRAKAHIEIRGA
jgi:glucosamine 6-phosphate synthetase-like amidotransferase/phosphosugar isomerase protein